MAPLPGSEKLSIYASNGDPMDHPPLKMMMLRYNILSFNKLKGESVYELWQRFKSILQQCPTHGISDKMLLECLYQESKEGPPYESRSEKVVEKCRLASKRASRHIVEEVGDPDPDCRWTQENFTLEYVKVGEPRKLWVNRRPGQRSRSNPLFGPPHQLRIL
uniref:Retrotransposon gag protein n=1 Tax=Solanum tuberosum TaxID=4113 RepID=M1D8I3_SOLTU